MFEYLVKRLATIVPTLLLVSMLIFGLQQLLPGDPAKILPDTALPANAGLRGRCGERCGATPRGAAAASSRGCVDLRHTKGATRPGARRS